MEGTTTGVYLSREVGSAPLQRIGFGVQYPAGSSGEIPLASFIRTVPFDEQAYARCFNLMTSMGATAIDYLGDGSIYANSTSGTYYPFKAMARATSISVFWQPSTGVNSYLGIDLGTKISKHKLLRYVITCLTAGYAPSAWKVEGFTDTASWVLLDTQTNQTDWTGESARREFVIDVPANTYFRGFKITFTAAPTILRIMGWELYGISEEDTLPVEEDEHTVNLYLDTATQTIRVRGADGSLWADSPTVLVPDLWHYLEFAHDPASGGSVSFNGLQICTWNETTAPIEKVQLGSFEPFNGYYYLDDIVVSEGTPAPGPCKVHYLTPDSEGAYSDWSPNSTDVTPTLAEIAASKAWGWYEADNIDGQNNATCPVDGNIPVSMIDLSGHGHNLTTRKSSPKVYYDQINGQPAIYFSGIDGFYRTFSEPHTNEWHFYVVYQSTGVGSSHYPWFISGLCNVLINAVSKTITANMGVPLIIKNPDFGNWDALHIHSSSPPNNADGAELLTQGKQSRGWLSYLDSRTVGTFSIGGQCTNGSTWTNYFKGSIAMILIVQDALTDEEEAIIRTYIQEKYGLAGLTKSYPGGTVLDRTQVVNDGFDSSYLQAMQGTASFSFTRRRLRSAGVGGAAFVSPLQRRGRHRHDGRFSAPG